MELGNEGGTGRGEEDGGGRDKEMKEELLGRLNMFKFVICSFLFDYNNHQAALETPIRRYFGSQVWTEVN